MRYPILLLCFAMLVFASCRRVTHGGDHCVARIDGDKFRSRDKALMFGGGALTARASGNTLLIECDDQKGGEEITIWLTDSTSRNTESGKFSLSGVRVGAHGHYGNFASYSDNSKSLSNEYYTDGQHTGTVKVRYTNGRVTGSFSFKAKYEGASGEDVEVANGSFSIPLNE